MHTTYKRIRRGETPAVGTIVELCRSNWPRHPSVLESFVADGRWTVPSTAEGFYYRAATAEDIQQAIAQYF